MTSKFQLRVERDVAQMYVRHRDTALEVEREVSQKYANAHRDLLARMSTAQPLVDLAFAEADKLDEQADRTRVTNGASIDKIDLIREAATELRLAAEALRGPEPTVGRVYSYTSSPVWVSDGLLR